MRSINRLVMILFVLMAFGTTSIVFAQTKDAKETTKDKKEKVDVPARTIDFKAQLGSGTLALDQVGIMIDDGRKYGDVNSLVSASMILFMEEKATGKKAQITANDLLKEAQDLAVKQKNVTALKTIAQVWENPLFGNNKSEAKNLSSTISSIESELASTRGPGAKVVDVKVENYTAYTIYVYIDGIYKGYINPGYYVVFTNIGKGWTDLYAETDNMWSSSQGRYIYYYWSNSYNLLEYDYTTAADFTWSVY